MLPTSTRLIFFSSWIAALFVNNSSSSFLVVKSFTCPDVNISATWVALSLVVNTKKALVCLSFGLMINVWIPCLPLIAYDLYVLSALTALKNPNKLSIWLSS